MVGLRKRYLALLVILGMVLTLGIYFNKSDKNNIKIKNIIEKINIENSKKELVKIEDDFDFPEESGPVKELPWTKDEEFLKAQRENNTQVLMAAYCAVLTEPLPGEEFNVDFASESLKGSVLEKDEEFSQNEKLGPYTKERGYKKGSSFAGSSVVESEGGGVCKIAAGLYNTAIYSNLEIVERHNHTMPVNYVPYGQDATVTFEGYKDFIFKNNRNYPILIWSEFIENRLYIAFYGEEASPEVEWSHRLIDQTEAPIEYIDDLEGSIQGSIVRKGIDGAKVESKVIVKYKDGRTETKDLGISSYIPLPHLIGKSK